MPSLIVVTDQQSATHHALAGRTIEIGRSPKCELQIIDDSVSRQHARVQYTKADDSYAVLDLGSSNGTSVNGQAVSAARALSDGDEITLGSVRIRFTVEAFESPDAAFEFAMLEKWFGEDDRNTIVGR